ncbi:MAG TPA: hypothetical protein VGA50_03465 [Kiloniellales bacterium]
MSRTARARSSRLATSAKRAVGAPTRRQKSFSRRRFWQIRNTSVLGRKGTRALSVSTVARGMFSNSKVTRSTAAAKRASASSSS